ncbi:MAG: exo-alpha-sialidase [Blastopirellula sp. JB062]
MLRRELLFGGLSAGVTAFTLGRWPHVAHAKEHGAPKYELTRQVPTRLFDGKQCWCHPRAGIVPNAGQNGAPRVVMTMSTLDLAGVDVFKNMYGLQTDDLGQTWTDPQPQEALAVRYETIDGQKRPVAISDFWPAWHKGANTLLGTGHTVVYTPDWKVSHSRPRDVAYAVYDADQSCWKPWRKMALPAGPKFRNAGAGCTQRYDLADGTILLPIYFTPPGANSKVSVARCSWDGTTLTYLEHGNELAVDDKTRGLHEPSLAQFGGKFFLTIRNDRQGYVTCSDDGLHYEPIRPWKFDDGSDLGNYNTQQHWVTHSGGLFLAYTRRGADNDHVFRHRAPLFMAQVDPQSLRVIRETEQVLVPERGARLGNFGVTQISDNETWVTVSEWMQPLGVEKHGSDGSLYVAQIKWK